MSTTTIAAASVATSLALASQSGGEISAEAAAAMLIVFAASVVFGTCVAAWYAIKGDPWDSPLLMGTLAGLSFAAICAAMAVIAMLVHTAAPAFA